MGRHRSKGAHAEAPDALNAWYLNILSHRSKCSPNSISMINSDEPSRDRGEVPWSRLRELPTPRLALSSKAEPMIEDPDAAAARSTGRVDGIDGGVGSNFPSGLFLESRVVDVETGRHGWYEILQ